MTHIRLVGGLWGSQCCPTLRRQAAAQPRRRCPAPISGVRADPTVLAGRRRKWEFPDRQRVLSLVEAGIPLRAALTGALGRPSLCPEGLSVSPPSTRGPKGAVEELTPWVCRPQRGSQGKDWRCPPLTSWAPSADTPAWEHREAIPRRTVSFPVPLPLRSSTTSGTGLPESGCWRPRPRLRELRAGLGCPAAPPPLRCPELPASARPRDSGSGSCSQGWKRSQKPQSREHGDVWPFAQEAFATSGLCYVSPLSRDVPTDDRRPRATRLRLLSARL